MMTPLSRSQVLHLLEIGLEDPRQAETELAVNRLAGPFQRAKKRNAAAGRSAMADWIMSISEPIPK